MQDVLDGLYTKLVADTGSGSLHEKLGGRIYDTQAEQNDEFPFMVFSVVSGEPNEWFGPPVTQVVLVDFDIYTTKLVDPGTSTGAGVIEEALYDLLRGFDLTVSGHDRGAVKFLTRSARFVDEDAVRITDRIEIMATQFA